MRSQSEYEFSKARLVIAEDEQDAMQDIFHDEVSTLFRGAREKWLDYISLTDMTQNFKGAEQLIKNWLQNKNTIDFLGVWEKLNNPNFNLVEFHQIKNEAGLNRFVMSAKLLEATRRLLDLKAEKKSYNREINDQIKDAEARLKELVRDNKGK